MISSLNPRNTALLPYVDTVSSYHTARANEIRRPEDDTSSVLRLARQVADIQRETEYVRQTGDVPPQWKMNYLPRLNVL